MQYNKYTLVSISHHKLETQQKSYSVWRAFWFSARKLKVFSLKTPKVVAFLFISLFSSHVDLPTLVFKHILLFRSMPLYLRSFSVSVFFLFSFFIPLQHRFNVVPIKSILIRKRLVVFAIQLKHERLSKEKISY